MNKVEELKAQGEYFKAGELAFTLGYDAVYGCHYGLRKDLQLAKEMFNLGWRNGNIKAIAKDIEVLFDKALSQI